jgi:hypothetical protein
MTGQIPPYGANFRRVSLAYSRDLANRAYVLKRDPRWFIRSDKSSEKWTIYWIASFDTALRPVEGGPAEAERTARYTHLAVAMGKPLPTFTEAMAKLLDGIRQGFYPVVIVHAGDCGLQGSGLDKHCTCQPAEAGVTAYGDDPDSLQAALDYVGKHGFGDCVDDDSIIEDAARIHLAGLLARRTLCASRSTSAPTWTRPLTRPPGGRRTRSWLTRWRARRPVTRPVTTGR